MDSKTNTVIETTINIAIGFIVSYILQLIVLPLFGYDVTYGHAFGIVVIYTLFSWVRLYLVRRLFAHIFAKRRGCESN